MQTLIQFFFNKGDIIIWYKVISEVTVDTEMNYHISL